MKAVNYYLYVYDSIIMKNMQNQSKLGNNIKKYRAKLGLTQEDLVKKSSVKYTTLSKIESGVIKMPSVQIVAKIAKALGVSIEDLIK